MTGEQLARAAKEYAAQLQRDRVTSVASELAYSFLFSLFPFLVFAVAVLAYTPVDSDRVLDLMGRYVPGPLVETIEGTIRGVLENRSGGLLSLGILGVLWSASRAANEVIFAINRAYDAAVPRSFWRARLLALGVTGLLVLSVALSLLLPVFGWVLSRVSALLGLSAGFLRIWELVRWGFSLLLLALGFLAVYYVAPNTQQRLREAAPGAVVAAIGWQLGSYAFSVYLSNFANYSAVYGSLGGVIALMVWLYLAGLVLLLGGELNAFLHRGAQPMGAAEQVAGRAEERTKAPGARRAALDRGLERGLRTVLRKLAGSVRKRPLRSVAAASGLGTLLGKRLRGRSGTQHRSVHRGG